MKKQIIECVPNFSEGRNTEIINDIAREIEASDGVSLLNIDPGAATNRTVITFAGEPHHVVEAAFQAVKRASELIDMRQQSGTHPRLGATDVLPLVPIWGISLDECVQLARKLAQRISEELFIPTYCYGAAALREERENLAVCRRGEYEALPQRVMSDDAPDFGARPYDQIIAQAGATNVGARDFLIAVNFNLDTTSVATASAIAAEVRQSGSKSKAGKLKACKAIGWYIEEYGIAQVSMNLTNIAVTPLHVAYAEVCRSAEKHGARVTGTEIIGLVPCRALIEAGQHFATCTTLTEQQLIELAIKEMSLDDLCEFDPRKKILENLLEYNV